MQNDFIFNNGFPHINNDIVKHVITSIPLETYSNVSKRVTTNEINFLINGTSMSFPYRLYALEVEESVFLKTSFTERMILHCIYTRSCDGYVREKHIKALLSSDFPNWAIPYIVKICDEYVLEILQTVYNRLRDRNTDEFKAFCSENSELFRKSYNRMISYWNAYYRNEYFKYKDYIGWKLFVDRFGADHIIYHPK